MAPSVTARACKGAPDCEKHRAAVPISTTLPAYITPMRVRDLRDHREIVRDEEHGQREFLAQLGQQVKDLRLDGDVQRRRGLVGDQQRRPIHHGHGDHHALALAAGKLVGIVARAALGVVDGDGAKRLDGQAPRIGLADLRTGPGSASVASPALGAPPSSLQGRCALSCAESGPLLFLSSRAKRGICCSASVGRPFVLAADPAWASTASAIWSPTRITGFSAVIGSWKIMLIPAPRMCRISGFGQRQQLFAAKPDAAMNAGLRRQQAQDGQRADRFSRPDSPTSPSTSPAAM